LRFSDLVIWRFGDLVIYPFLKAPAVAGAKQNHQIPKSPNHQI
jgi:hypothetical protein